MRHIIAGRTVVCSAVVVVLKSAAEAIHIERIVTQAVSHRFAISVIERVLQSVGHALA